MKRAAPTVCLAVFLVAAALGLATGEARTSDGEQSGPRPGPTPDPLPTSDPLATPDPWRTGPGGWMPGPAFGPQRTGPTERVPARDAPPITRAAPREPFADAPAADPRPFQNDPRPFQEGHWQGIEVIPLTPALARSLGIPPGARGVIVDDVTLPADLQGFQAGDLVVSVGEVPTPDISSFLRAADRVRERQRAPVQVLRNGEVLDLVLTARILRLGTANGETAPMIRPGSQPPHAYLGPCTQCHRIGTTGQLPTDQGDLLTRQAPAIRAGQQPPHRDRGECATCHRVIP